MTGLMRLWLGSRFLRYVFSDLLKALDLDVTDVMNEGLAAV